jgi:hypothetical protein
VEEGNYSGQVKDGERNGRGVYKDSKEIYEGY